MENLGTNSSKGDRNGQNSRERKTWTTALESRFAQVEEVLGSRRRDLVRQILDHPEDTYFLTSRQVLQRRYGYYRTHHTSVRLRAVCRFRRRSPGPLPESYHPLHADEVGRTR